MIVTLGLPPLAAALPERSTLATSRAARKLDVSAASSRAYLARIDAEQRQAIVALRRAIPEARVGARYRIVLNGLTLSLPVRRLPTLFELGFVRKVYPNLHYTASLNRGPSIIGAPAFHASTGARGEGVMIAVVDDGIDHEHPFFDPSGFSYPAGFPKGDLTSTTPKVIVARAFPGPGSRAPGRDPLDRARSFHGTHVGGVAAGVAGTTAPAGNLPTCVLGSGGCHPAVAGLSGVAPRAWLGNYRVFTVPNPLGGCCVANTPEIVAAFEAAVADGMDVINFSGGGPQSDPASDAMIETIANVVRAGVVPVISAGNDRDLFGLGTVGSPSTAPDAISVAAVSNAHVFGRALTVVSPAVPSLRPIQVVPAPGGIPDAWATGDQRLVDVGAITGTDGRRVDRLLCGSTLPPGSLNGVIALVSRGACTFEAKAARAGAAGAAGLIVVDNRSGDATGIPLRLGVPSGMIAYLDGAALREAMAGSGGRAAIRIGTELLEIETNRGGIPASFSAGGLTAFGHELKPDVAAPGANVLSSTLSEFAGAPYAVLDGTSFAAPHIAGAAALLLQRHPTWTPKQVKSALMSTAGPAFDPTAPTGEAPVYLAGAGLARLTAADAPRIFTDPPSLSFRDLNVNAGAAGRPLLVTVSDAGSGAG
ncbi:MAG: S8 family serine peptidase, partial [Gaiellaceae bacterium]